MSQQQVVQVRSRQSRHHGHGCYWLVVWYPLRFLDPSDGVFGRSFCLAALLRLPHLELLFVCSYDWRHGAVTHTVLSIPCMPLVCLEVGLQEINCFEACLSPNLHCIVVS